MGKCAKRRQKSISMNKAYGKNTSNCTRRWAARIIGDNPVNGFINHCRQYSEDGSKCKMRLCSVRETETGCSHGQCWDRSESKSLAIYYTIYSWTIHLSNHLTKPRTVLRGVKQLRDWGCATWGQTNTCPRPLYLESWDQMGWRL